MQNTQEHSSNWHNAMSVNDVYERVRNAVNNLRDEGLEDQMKTLDLPILDSSKSGAFMCLPLPAKNCWLAYTWGWVEYASKYLHQHVQNSRMHIVASTHAHVHIMMCVQTYQDVSHICGPANMPSTYIGAYRPAYMSLYCV